MLKPLLVASLMILSLPAGRSASAEESKTPPASEGKSRKSGEVDRALEEFRAAAARLEKALSKAAGENAKEVGRKIDRGMGEMVNDLTRAMDRAARKIEKGRSKPKVKADGDQEI